MKYQVVLFLALLWVAPSAWAEKTNLNESILPSNKSSKLLNLDNQVDALEGKVDQLENRIKLINEKIFKKNFKIGNTILQIYHKNMIGGAFRITKIIGLLETYTQDNNQTWKLENTTTVLSAGRIFSKVVPVSKKIFDQGTKSVRHLLKIKVELQGHGYGVFTYMKGYKVNFSREISFVPLEKRVTQIVATLQERGTNDYKNRFYYEFKIRRR